MTAGFEARKGPQVKECGKPPKVGKIKETDSPLDLPERPLDFSPVKPISVF